MVLLQESNAEIVALHLQSAEKRQINARPMIQRRSKNII